MIIMICLNATMCKFCGSWSQNSTNNLYTLSEIGTIFWFSHTFHILFAFPCKIQRHLFFSFFCINWWNDRDHFKTSKTELFLTITFRLLESKLFQFKFCIFMHQKCYRSDASEKKMNTKKKIQSAARFFSSQRGFFE